MRFRRSDPTKPYFFWDRVWDAREGIMGGLLMCFAYSVLGIWLVMMYLLFSHLHDHSHHNYLVDFFRNNWKWIAGFEALMLYMGWANLFDQITREDSISFHEGFNQRLVELEKAVYQQPLSD